MEQRTHLGIKIPLPDHGHDWAGVCPLCQDEGRADERQRIREQIEGLATTLVPTATSSEDPHRHHTVPHVPIQAVLDLLTEPKE